MSVALYLFVGAHYYVWYVWYVLTYVHVCMQRVPIVGRGDRPDKIGLDLTQLGWAGLG